MKQMPVLSGLSTANRVLAEFADRKPRQRERGRRHGMQEVALVLGRVRGPQQLGRPILARNAGVMTRCDRARTETAHIVQADAELDLAVAEHVRIRGAAGRVLAQEMGKYAFTVLTREDDTMQRNRQFVADAARVLVVLGRRAIGVVVVLPVGHEEPLNRMARALQQQGRDGGVDAAGHADDDGAGGIRGGGGRRFDHAPL